MGFFYSFPAIRGYQAKQEFFSIMCPLGLLSKLFSFYNDEIPEEFRAQRIINEKRIPDIRDYILNNSTDYVFSSITASIDGEYDFISSNENENIGILRISMDSHLLINDGQHRKAAIDEAVRINKALADEAISVVLFVDQGLLRSQQMFSDLNRHAVNVSSSLSILYNHRDEAVGITKKYLEHNRQLKKYIDMSSTSLAQKSNKMFILSIFHRAFMNTIGDHKEEVEKKILKAFDYWDEVCSVFGEWNIILRDEVSPYYSRKNSIATYGVVLEAIGLLGLYLLKNQSRNWKKYVQKLNTIDWGKSNHQDWLNRCITPTGNISKSNRQVKLTYNKIKELIGLELSSEEKKLEELFNKES